MWFKLFFFYVYVASFLNPSQRRSSFCLLLLAHPQRFVKISLNSSSDPTERHGRGKLKEPRVASSWRRRIYPRRVIRCPRQPGVIQESLADQEPVPPVESSHAAPPTKYNSHASSCVHGRLFRAANCRPVVWLDGFHMSFISLYKTFFVAVQLLQLMSRIQKKRKYFTRLASLFAWVGSCNEFINRRVAILIHYYPSVVFQSACNNPANIHFPFYPRRWHYVFSVGFPVVGSRRCVKSEWCWTAVILSDRKWESITKSCILGLFPVVSIDTDVLAFAL